MTWRIKGRRYWTDAETLFLHRNFKKLSGEEIAARLDIPYAIVKRKALFEGLRHPLRMGTAPIGERRVYKEGGYRYLYEKIDSGHKQFHQDWKRYHVLVWIRANGPIPAGHKIAFKPGRRSLIAEEITIDCLELTTNAELVQRHKPPPLPPELREVAQLRRTLLNHVRRREHAKQNIRPS